MIFRPRQKKCYFNINLTINGKQIEQIKETVFWGVILDEHLSWKPQISYVGNKLSKSIGIIYKSSFYLFKSCLRTLYFSLIYPYLYYCSIIWATTYKSNLCRIERLQKRIIRIISKTKFDAHSLPLFRENKILKFHDICSLQIGQFMFSYKHGLLPKCFDNLFTTKQTNS